MRANVVRRPKLWVLLLQRLLQLLLLLLLVLFSIVAPLYTEQVGDMRRAKRGEGDLVRRREGVTVVSDLELVEVKSVVVP